MSQWLPTIKVGKVGADGPFGQQTAAVISGEMEVSACCLLDKTDRPGQ